MRRVRTLPLPPPSLYCPYSEDLQDTPSKPLSSSFTSGGSHACPACGVRIGIDIRDPQQAVGTLSGGERQCVAIARAVYFGAKVLILDEPTSALGVAQTSMVLKYINLVRSKGLGVIFITHNVRHAYAVGDRFTVLNRGKTLGTHGKDRSRSSPHPLHPRSAGG